MLLYFSATGNTKHVVDEIKLKDETIISIEEATKSSTYQFQLRESRLGIITPTYDFVLPSIVEEFLQKLDFTSTTNPTPSMWEPTAPPREQLQRLRTQ